MENKVIEFENVKVLDDYEELGSGVEGRVVKYTEDKVIKIFSSEVDVSTIVERIKYFLSIKVSNFAFPLELVVNSSHESIGYTMPLIATNKYKSFFNLYECQDNKEFVTYFQEAQASLKELHKKEIYVGDFNPNNILIAKNNKPIFVDTINYATPAFDFLLKPYNSMLFKRLFKKECSYLTNDIFMFTFLFISFYVSFEDLEKVSKDTSYFRNIISNFNISEKAKERLLSILAASDNISYIDDVLKEFLENEHKRYDNKFGKVIKLFL